MPNEELVATVKKIVTARREGKEEEAWNGFRDLFAAPAFPKYEPAEQRQALKLMIDRKLAPHMPKPWVIEAHRAALGPLTELVSAHNDPADYELLGICHVVVGNEQAAGNIFRTGLKLERDRDPQSTLCGSLMKWVAAV
jgi:hypothetical protein